MYDQRMIRICTSLSKKYNVSLWGRRKSSVSTSDRPYKQKRTKFLFNKGPVFYLEFNLRLFLRLLFTSFDIVHAVDLDTLPACYLASKIKRKQLVYDAHEYFTEVPELINRPKVQNIWLRIEQWILPNVKNAITVGEMIAKEYEAKYGVPFTVIRNCPNLKDQALEEGIGEYLLYQGALNMGRGLDEAILAMHQIDMELHIAGSGDLDGTLREFVMIEGLDDKVKFLGLVAPDDLPQITQKAFAGINVSENLGLSYYYSLNNKYFDYIHAGIPAVTNDFPEYQNLNSKYKCSVLCEATPDSIAQAVKLLIDDKELYQELKKNSLIARQELNWQNEETVLLRFYGSLT